MTVNISGLNVAQRLSTALPGAVLAADAEAVTIDAARVAAAALFLRDDAVLDCKYLNCLTAVDWLDYFEVVYLLSSLHFNHTLTLKVRADHSQPLIPSVAGVWLSANLQEREAFDLMGIAFGDHPGLKRVFLWEGFPGHPLRKDFLTLPGGVKPGLQRFPFEFPEGQRGYPALDATLKPDAPAVPRLDQPAPPAATEVAAASDDEPQAAEIPADRGGDEPQATEP